MKALRTAILTTAILSNCGIVDAYAMRLQTTPDKVHPTVREMVDTIRAKGQDATCMQGGVFRKSIVRPGSPFPVAGGNCQSKDFFMMAIVTCGDYKDSSGAFMTSTCGKIGSSLLGYQSIESAKQYITQAVKDGRPDAIYLVCQTPPDKLKGALKEIADANCEPKAEVTATPAPTRPSSQPPAPTRKRSAAVSGVTPAALKARPPVTFVQGALRDLPRRETMAIDNLMMRQRHLEDLKQALRSAAEQGKELKGAGKTVATPVEQLQVLPKLADVDQQTATALSNLKVKLESQRPTSSKVSDIAKELAEMEQIVNKMDSVDREIEAMGIRFTPDGKIEYFNATTRTWGPDL